MDIFFGVDGMGPDDNNAYEADFANSHVRRLWKEWHTPTKHYLRGPSLAGTETKALMEKGYVWVKDALAQHKVAQGSVAQNRLFLSGYSRGGAAVIALAHKLAADGIPVHGMLLFDAVDRSSLGNTEKIPGNVAACSHALRNPKAVSRESFGNCGRKYAASVAYVEQYFMCTHGAVGGTPWKKNGRSGKIEEMSNGQKTTAIVVTPRAARPLIDQNDFTNVTVEDDKLGSAASWKWMSGNLLLMRASKAGAGSGSFGLMGKSRAN